MDCVFISERKNDARPNEHAGRYQDQNALENRSRKEGNFFAGLLRGNFQEGSERDQGVNNNV